MFPSELETKLAMRHKLGVGEFAGGIDKAGIQVQVPLNIATSGGSTKLVINRPTAGKADRAEITSIARGICWFEDLTSGKARSIRHIAGREGVIDRYISRLIEGALISPVLVERALDAVTDLQALCDFGQ
jgi:hypothetical protein